MGSKKSTTNTTQNQQTHLTTTPTNPSWVDKGLEGMGGYLTELMGGDPSRFIAGPDRLQTQAGDAAGRLTTSPLYGDAASMIRGSATGANTYNPATGTASLVGDIPQVQAASLLDGLEKYYNPYKEQILNPVLADYDHNASQQRAQSMLDLAGDSTFGGSGGSIYRSALEGDLARGRAATEGGLLSDMFKTSTGLASDDASRRQSASSENVGYALQRALANMTAQNTYGLANMDALNTAGRFNAGQADTAAGRSLAAGTALGSLGAQQSSDERANIGTQANIGSILQALAQQRAGAPLALAQGLTSMWSQLPLGLLHGQTADGTMNGTSTGTSRESGAGLSDWLSFFGNAARAAATAGAGG